MLPTFGMLQLNSIWGIVPPICGRLPVGIVPMFVVSS